MTGPLMSGTSVLGRTTDQRHNSMTPHLRTLAARLIDWSHSSIDTSKAAIFFNTDKVPLQILRMFTERYNFETIENLDELYIPVGNMSPESLTFVTRWLQDRELDGSKPPTISFFRDICHTSFFLGIDSLLDHALTMLWHLMAHAHIALSDKPLEDIWQDSIPGSPVLDLYSWWYVKSYIIDRRNFSEA